MSSWLTQAPNSRRQGQRPGQRDRPACTWHDGWDVDQGNFVIGAKDQPLNRLEIVLQR
jgi:hypothetical protein